MSNQLTAILTKEASNIADILGFNINSKSFIKFDGSSNNEQLKNIDLTNVEAFTNYAFHELKLNNAVGSIGGYLEKRVLYADTNHFQNSDRNTHLGVDIFMEVETPIFAPLSGKVHSFNNNIGEGNYGPTIILEHKIGGFSFHTLYGHLSVSSLNGISVGKQIGIGKQFCAIGNYPENGNWPPHLHFQIIIDIEDCKGDYPGVCAAKDLAYYTENCPNPNLILQADLLK